MIEFIFIIAIILCVDFGWTGFLPVLLNISNSLDEIENSDIVYSGVVGILACPEKLKCLGFRVKYAAGIKLILTKDYLYIQDTMRSYAAKFPVNTFKNVTIGKDNFPDKVTGKQIVITTINDQVLKFKTLEPEKWLKLLSTEVASA